MPHMGRKAYSPIVRYWKGMGLLRALAHHPPPSRCRLRNASKHARSAENSDSHVPCFISSLRFLLMHSPYTDASCLHASMPIFKSSPNPARGAAGDEDDANPRLAASPPRQSAARAEGAPAASPADMRGKGRGTGTWASYVVQATEGVRVFLPFVDDKEELPNVSAISCGGHWKDIEEKERFWRFGGPGSCLVPGVYCGWLWF